MMCLKSSLYVLFMTLKLYLLNRIPQKDVATGVLFGNREGTEISPFLKIVKEACINFEIPHKIIIFDPTLES